MEAMGKSQWLQTHWFPSQMRKHPNIAFVALSPEKNDGRPPGGIEIITTNKGADNDNEGSPSSPLSPPPMTASTEEEELAPKWKKSITSALKKIQVDDLGDMDASALRDSIPLSDGEGRGMANLEALQKKLAVSVVFCDMNGHDDIINGHVLLVGNKAKLEKKCFEMRNILSHYHWRLSGTDVAMDATTTMGGKKFQK